MVCPHCRTPNPDGNTVCSRCNTALAPEDATVAMEPGTRAWSQPTVGPAGVGEAWGALGPGEVLAGRYEILKLLGEGGMGSVYRARDRELDREVAVKVIKPELASNAQVLQRFKQELILARQVTHRNIIRIFDLGTAEWTRFITMEYIEGEDLSSILARRGKLPAVEAAGIIQQVCRGLEAAHAEGVVHRDLKPQNIMIDSQGKVSVMDFGIARSMDTASMTRTGALLGTPTYMSPEQAQGQKVDARSDLYALGIIFYELLTGKAPFEADNPMVTLVKRIQEKAAPPIQLEPSIPKALNEMVVKMLATSPEERYQSAGEILQDLEAWEAQRTGQHPRKTGAVAPAARRADWPARIAFAGMLAMLATITWLYLHKPGRPPGPPRRVSVLVADFKNDTRDPVFDGTLEPAIGLALEGASFVTAFPRGDARKLAAKLKPGDTKLDVAAARLVAISQGIDVVVGGKIDPRGSGYEITVEAIDPASGKALLTKDASASSKQDVLAEATRLAAPIRKRLGDTRADSALLRAETYTSSSLEAAQEYARGQDLQWSGKAEAAIEAYKKAIQSDPNMGRAYAGVAVEDANLGQRQEADQYFQAAMAHVDRMTERERYRTYGAYYLAVRNDDKAIEQYSQLIAKFPADDAALTNLATAYLYKGNIGKAIEEGQAAVKLNPRNALYAYNEACYLMYGGQFENAIGEAAGVLKLDGSYRKAYVVTALSQLALGNADAAAANYRKLAGMDARGASMAAMGLADIALYQGRNSEAAAILTQGVAADLENKSVSPAARKMAVLAEAESGAGAAETASRALATDHHTATAFLAAQVLIEGHQEAKASGAIAAMSQRLEPEPRAYAKLLEGEALLAKDKAREAIAVFEDAQKLSDTWMGRLDLGRAYLADGHFTEASQELSECANRMGQATAVFLDEVPTFHFYPLVYYYQARAEEGLKSAGAADSYKRFLSLKSHAEPTDVLVQDARKRAVRLGVQP